MKTTGACLAGIERIERKDRDLVPGEGQVLVQTHLAGICGTDKNFYLGNLPPTGGLDTEIRKELVYPFFFGHEGGGTVMEVGDKVRRFSIGDRVMSFGWVDTFAEFFLADEEDLEPAPKGLSLDVASLGEPVGCAMFSGLHSDVQLGDTVVVFGMGFAGQILAQVAKRKGAHRVIAVDVVAEKLQLALRLGADVAIHSREQDPVTAVLDLTHGMGADVAVETAGTQEAVNQCTATVRHNGTLVFYSWITREVTLNISRWHNNSLRILNTGLVHHSREERRLWTPLALRPVSLGQVDVEALITHRFPLDRIEEAFRVAKENPAAVKVVLEA